MKDRIRIESIDLSELYPDLEKGRPVTTKLRTLLRQVDLKIDTQSILENNSYLDRLVTECKLFLPEMFQSRLPKSWEFPLARKMKETLIKSSTDLIIFPEREVTIIDWTGIEINPVARAKAYLLCQQLNLTPARISIVTLISNDLKSDLRIKFSRKVISNNDLVICERDLRERLESIEQGVNPLECTLKPGTKPNPLLEIENIPEIII